MRRSAGNIIKNEILTLLSLLHRSITGPAANGIEAKDEIDYDVTALFDQISKSGAKPKSNPIGRLFTEAKDR